MRVIIDNKYNIGDEVCYFDNDGYNYNNLHWAKVKGVGYSKQQQESVYLLYNDEEGDEFMDTEDNLFSDEEEAINTLI